MEAQISAYRTAVPNTYFNVHVFAALLGVESSWFVPVLLMSMERGFLVLWTSDGQLFWEEVAWLVFPSRVGAPGFCSCSGYRQTCIDDALNSTCKFRLAVHVTGSYNLFVKPIPSCAFKHQMKLVSSWNKMQKERGNPAFPGKRSSGAAVPSPIPCSACPQTSILLTHPSLIPGNKWHPHMVLHQNRAELEKPGQCCLDKTQTAQIGLLG